MNFKALAAIAASSLLIASCGQKGQSAADFLGYDPDEQALIFRFLTEAREAVKVYSNSIENAGGENDG